MYTMQSIITHFRLSANHASDVTFSGKRAASVLFTMQRDELNRCSHGTEVAGTQSTVFTKLARMGKRWLFRWPKFNRILIPHTTECIRGLS